MPLFQEVLADLLADQRSLLVLDTADLWVLHLLHVEAQQFLGQCGNRNHPGYPTNPGHDSFDPVLQ